MNDIIESNGGIVSFSLFKVEKGREKLCKCNPPHYEIDTVNRIVTCKDCGATLEPFDALITLCRHMDRYKEYQQEAIQRTNAYREMANKEYNRRMRNRAFKEMDSQYQRGMFPCCPICKKAFDPVKIVGWTNKNYMEAENE